MKSYFSRFLHITSSYSGLTRISKWKKFANWFDLDTPVKPECDTLGKSASSGRSRPEMLKRFNRRRHRRYLQRHAEKPRNQIGG